MKYIGLSLGRCLTSLMKAEVAEKDVMFIVTRTNCPKFDQYINVVEQYHSYGNPGATAESEYELCDFPLEKVTALATRLWQNGRIHQPRIFVGDSFGSYRHPGEYGDGVWMQVVPGNANTNPAVVDAYEKYKMLDALTK